MNQMEAGVKARIINPYIYRAARESHAQDVRLRQDRGSNAGQRDKQACGSRMRLSKLIFMARTENRWDENSASDEATVGPRV